MCGDGHGQGVTDEGTRGGQHVSRRSLLLSAAATPAAAMMAAPLGAKPRPPQVDGTYYSMGMHIHSSFSERWGSMHAHLDQAQQTGIDVIWWTDHDTKMSGINAKDVVHFTSLTNELGDGSP